MKDKCFRDKSHKTKFNFKIPEPRLAQVYFRPWINWQANAAFGEYELCIDEWRLIAWRQTTFLFRVFVWRQRILSSHKKELNTPLVPELYYLFHICPCFLKTPILTSELYCFDQTDHFIIKHLKMMTWHTTCANDLKKTIKKKWHGLN